MRLCVKLLIYVLGAITAAIASPLWAQGRGGGATVELADVQSERFDSVTGISGAIILEQRLVVTSPLSGTLRLENVKTGDRVSSGSLLATIDTDRLSFERDILLAQGEQNNAEAEQIARSLALETELLGLAERQYQLADSKYKRAQKLSSQQVVSADALESALTSLVSSEQQLILRRQAIGRLESQLTQNKLSRERLELQIKEIDRDISSSQVVVPADSQLLSLAGAQNRFVREGDIIAELARDTGYEISADIPSELVRFITPGQKIQARTASGRVFSARIRAILPQQNQRTATRSIRLTPDDILPAALRAAGASVVVEIPEGPATDIISIPKDGLLPVEGGYIVFVANDGKAERRNVEIGSSRDGRIAILSGLAAGEQVVVKGNEGLTDGASLKGNNAQARADKPAAPAKPGPDAETWVLSWQTRRGEQTAELVLSQAVDLFNKMPVEVKKNGQNIEFTGELTLPFGIVELAFSGMKDQSIMSGRVKLFGLPNGNVPEFDFTGKRK